MYREGSPSGRVYQRVMALEHIPVMRRGRRPFQYRALCKEYELIVGHPSLSIDGGLGDQRQNVVFNREFERLTRRNASIVMPEVQLIADFVLMAIQVTQARERLIELEQVLVHEQ